MLEEGDLKWLWAAYRKDALSDVLPEGLEPETFRGAVAERLALFSEAWLLSGPEKPVGLVVGKLDEHDNLEVHARWFPWATPRNIVEASLRFIVDIGGKINLLIYSQMPNRHFFAHLMKYGVLDRVGHIARYYRDGERAVLFQSREM